MDIAPGLQVFEQLADGFFRVAVPFTLARGLVDTFTHMALVRLTSGNFIALATVDPNGPAKLPNNRASEKGLIKADIDKLTDNGAKLEAVIATHSFHTLAYEPFYKCYPDAKYYGCPRHLKKFPHIPWAGSVTDCKVQHMYEPEVSIRIPPVTAAEFSSPEPPNTNHFNSVLAKAGPVLFNDDMVCYFVNPKETMGRIVTWLTGGQHDSLMFHSSMFKGGLRQTPESATIFQAWLDELLEDWDFDVLCTAHNGVIKTGAKERFAQLVEETRPKLVQHAEQWAKGELYDPSSETQENAGAWSDNHGDSECG